MQSEDTIKFAKDAPIRLYLAPNGRKIVWEEGDKDNRQIPWWDGGVEMEEPDPSWELLQGFRTLHSFEDWLEGSGGTLATPREI